MSTAYVSHQTGTFPLDKFFDNPRFRYVAVFSTTTRDDGTNLNDHQDFYDNELIDLRTAMGDWTITPAVSGGSKTYEQTVTVTNSSGGPLSPTAVGFYLFVGFQDPTPNWLTTSSMDEGVDRQNWTITSAELNWDCLLAPNKVRIQDGTQAGTLIQANSYTADGVTVNIEWSAPIPGVDDPITILPVGTELAVIEDYDRTFLDTETGDVTFKLFGGNFTEAIY